MCNRCGEVLLGLGAMHAGVQDSEYAVDAWACESNSDARMRSREKLRPALGQCAMTSASQIASMLYLQIFCLSFTPPALKSSLEETKLALIMQVGSVVVQPITDATVILISM